MSKKPPKKSDLDKRWMNKRNKNKIFVQPEYHLIFCEGEKTEPNYFKEMKAIIDRNHPNRINIEIKGQGYNTLSLLEAAIKYVNKSLKPINHVWLVYDKDDFPPDDFDKVELNCRKMSLDRHQSIEYHALWSNECIELWFLLHFIYFDSNIKRTEYIKKLNEQLLCHGYGKYAKNSVKMYKILEPYRTIAIQNAKKIATLYLQDEKPSNKAPMTKVYEIFEKLDFYLKSAER